MAKRTEKEELLSKLKEWGVDFETERPKNFDIFQDKKEMCIRDRYYLQTRYYDPKVRRFLNADDATTNETSCGSNYQVSNSKLLSRCLCRNILFIHICYLSNHNLDCLISQAIL